ncbi:hypothetical protein BJ741DRAFT_539739, partial [Chytriomyces cf. hyalinus JEL632]
IFQSTGKKPQISPFLQLLVTLNRLGFHGNGAAYGKTSRFNNTRIGRLSTFTKRVFVAILSLEKQYVQWPNSAERTAITTAIQGKYAFQNCVGFIDGTLFPIETKPSESGEDFYTIHQPQYIWA